jgi:plastocyanin
MQKNIGSPVLPRRAILAGLGGVGLAAMLSACGGANTSDSDFATNVARNTLTAGGGVAPPGSAITATPASTGSHAASTASTVANGSSVATVPGSTVGTSAAATATIASGSGGAVSTVSATGPAPTHITGSGPLPKPLPTQGGALPTVIGAPSRASAAAGSPAASGTPTPAAKVTITAAHAFDPPQITINKNESIQWLNAGRSPQTVTDDPARAADKKNAVLPAGAQPWDSGVVGGGAQYTKVFDVPGDYIYFSIPAEGQGLVGRITVKG